MAETSLNRLNTNAFVAWFGKTALRLIGWRVDGAVPQSVPKAVVIVAPHTSNWDFPIGLLASFAMELQGHWVGKHTLFRKPFGRLMRWLGGIPLDRRASRNFVEQAADLFRQREQFLMVIAPEGTRGKVERWKSGFYHIARSASVPIVCAYIDFRRKVSGIGPIIMPSNDFKADIAKIRAFYETISPKNPDNFGGVKLRGE